MSDNEKELVKACKALLRRLEVKERQLAMHRLGKVQEKVFADLDKTADAEDNARAILEKLKEE